MNKFTWNNGRVDIECETGELSPEFVDSVDASALLDRCFGENDKLIKKRRKESAHAHVNDAIRKQKETRGY